MFEKGDQVVLSNGDICTIAEHKIMILIMKCI